MAGFSLIDLLERTENIKDSIKVLEIYVNEPLYRKINSLRAYKDLETERVRECMEEVRTVIQGYSDLSGAIPEEDLGKLQEIRREFQRFEITLDATERVLIRKKIFKESGEHNGNGLYSTVLKIISDPCDNRRYELENLKGTYLSRGGEVDERFERLWRLALRWIELGEEIERRRKRE